MLLQNEWQMDIFVFCISPTRDQLSMLFEFLELNQKLAIISNKIIIAGFE